MVIQHTELSHIHWELEEKLHFTFIIQCRDSSSHLKKENTYKTIRPVNPELLIVYVQSFSSRYSLCRKRQSVKKEINLASIIICIVFVFFCCNISRVVLNISEVIYTEDIIGYTYKASNDSTINIQQEINQIYKMRSHLHSTHLVPLCDEPQSLLSRPQCLRQLHHLSKSW